MRDLLGRIATEASDAVGHHDGGLGALSQVGKRGADRVQDSDEAVRAARKLRVAVLHEPEAKDQPQGQSIPARRQAEAAKCSVSVEGRTLS